MKWSSGNCECERSRQNYSRLCPNCLHVVWSRQTWNLFRYIKKNLDQDSSRDRIRAIVSGGVQMRDPCIPKNIPKQQQFQWNKQPNLHIGSKFHISVKPMLVIFLGKIYLIIKPKWTLTACFYNFTLPIISWWILIILWGSFTILDIPQVLDTKVYPMKYPIIRAPSWHTRNALNNHI